MQLRPYQEKAVADIRDAFSQGVRRPLLVMPCGAGKTQVFSYIAKGVASNGKRVLILAHRRELLQQISRSLGNWSVKHSIIDSESPGIPRTNVVVGSVFTVHRRLKWMPSYDLIIQDEAHHCSGTNTFSQVLQNYPTTRQLGVTATAARSSGEPLGDSFDDIVRGPGVAELTAMGHLCPLEVYAPAIPDLSGVHRRAGDYAVGELDDAMNKPTVTGDAVDHYRRYAHGKLAVVFCVSIAHSEKVAAAFRAAGYRSAHVDGKMETYRRDRILKEFSERQIDVLTSCSLITEGWDCPIAEVGIMLRPTQSMPLFIQMAGRLCRTYPGKQKAILLDAAGNTARHGFIDDAREWSLDGVRKTNTESVTRVMTCQKCFAAYRSPPCPRCGHVNETRGRKIKQVEGDLQLVADASEYDMPTTGHALKDLEKQYAILKNVGARRKMKNPNGWAFGIVSARFAAMQEAERNGVSYDDLALRTIEKDRVMTAMGNEDQVEGV